MSQQQIELQVQGMTCISCAQHVAHALESVAGVEKAIVPGWQSARATVIADEHTSPTALLDAGAQAGYSATIQKQEKRQSAENQASGSASNSDFDLLVIGGGSRGLAVSRSTYKAGQNIRPVN